MTIYQRMDDDMMDRLPIKIACYQSTRCHRSCMYKLYLNPVGLIELEQWRASSKQAQAYTKTKTGQTCFPRARAAKATGTLESSLEHSITYTFTNTQSHALRLIEFGATEILLRSSVLMIGLCICEARFLFFLLFSCFRTSTINP